MRAQTVHVPPELRDLPGIDDATAEKLRRLGVAGARQLALCDPAALAARWVDLEDHPNPAGLRRAFGRAVRAARQPQKRHL